MPARLLAFAALLTLPLAALTACSPTSDDDTDYGAHSYANAVANLEQGCQRVVQNKLGLPADFGPFDFRHGDADIFTVDITAHDGHAYHVTCSYTGEFLDAGIHTAKLKSITQTD